MRNLGFIAAVCTTAGLGLMVDVTSTSAFADTKVDCRQPPQAIINSLRGPDPVASLQRAGKALKSCGQARYIDLIVDRKTLALPFQARQVAQLAGIWVSDMWLHVEEAITPAIAELLSIEGNDINQGLIRWHDADNQKEPSYLDAYAPAIATAKLDAGPSGLKVTAFSPSDGNSIHNPYRPPANSDANRHIQMMLSAVTVHLGKITKIAVSDDRLMLVDSRGIVRTYRRHGMDNILASHKFFLAAEVSARSWPCVLQVLSGHRADTETQKRTLLMVAQALSIPPLQKSVAKITADLKQLKPKSAQAISLTKERQRLLQKLRAIHSDGFLKFVDQFNDPDQPPAYCRQ